MKIIRYSRAVLIFLFCISFFPSSSASGDILGKTLFATITEPKQTDIIDINVYKDNTFSIQGIAQRFSPVNLYVYSRVPQKIQNFKAVDKNGAITFSWEPRPIFQFNPLKVEPTSKVDSTFQYVKIVGNIKDASLFVQESFNNPQMIRQSVLNGTITIICHKQQKTGTAFFDLSFTKMESTLEVGSNLKVGSIFKSPFTIQETKNADALCQQIDNNGNIKPTFSLTNFSLPFLEGTITGTLVVKDSQIQNSTSLLFFEQNGNELHATSPEGCELVMWSDISQAVSGYRSFVSGNTEDTTTIELNATINSADAKCQDIDGKLLLGSLPIVWTKTVTNTPESNLSTPVSCETLQKHTTGFNCRGLKNTAYKNPYNFYDYLIGYRDSFLTPGEIVPSADRLKVNSQFMKNCEKPVYLLNTSLLLNGTNGHYIIDPRCEEIKCDYSACNKSFCSGVSLKRCNPPAVLNKNCMNQNGNSPVQEQISPCRTVDTTNDTGWFTTFFPRNDMSYLDTPGTSGLYNAPQSEEQKSVRHFDTQFNPLNTTSLNYQTSGYYLFSYATQTEELPCRSGKCGYDIVQDGAANSFSNYPIRDYVILSDGFLQYEIYAVEDSQYNKTEGVTRENGTLIAVLKDPSAKEITVSLPGNLQGKKLHFALFEVREGETGIGKNRPVTPRIPDKLMPYKNQQANGLKGVYGHLITTQQEIAYNPSDHQYSSYISPEKFEWEIFAEEGNYESVSIQPITTDKDEHFTVRGTTPYDENGVDAYVLNRFADTHIIVATYRSSDTKFESNNPATFFMKASRDALNFLSVKQTGYLNTMTTQTFNTYGVVYDAWTKNMLPFVQLEVQSTSKVGSASTSFITTGYEGNFTSYSQEGTFKIIPQSLEGKENTFVFPPSNMTQECTSKTDAPFQNLYCQSTPFTLQAGSNAHVDIPLEPTVKGTITAGKMYVIFIEDAYGNGDIAYSNPDGKFSFFLPAGTYKVKLINEINTKGDIVKTYQNRGQTVTVLSGKSTMLRIDL